MSKHRLKVTLTDQPEPDAAVSARKVSIRSRIARKLLGNPQQLTVLVPGNQVRSVEIIPQTTTSWRWPVPSVLPGVVVMPRERHRSEPLHPGAESDRGGGHDAGFRARRGCVGVVRGSPWYVGCSPDRRSSARPDSAGSYCRRVRSGSSAACPSTGSGGCAGDVGAGPHSVGAPVTGRPYRAGS